MIERFVEDVRVLEPPSGTGDVEQLPDGRTSLIVRVLGDGGDVVIAGPRTRGSTKRAARFRRATIVRFKPGWSAVLLGVGAHALRDRMVALDDLFAADLAPVLLASHGPREVLDALSRAIIPRETESASAQLARRAARMLDGESQVERVADQLGVTSRHLRRAFVEHVGVTPKHYARTARLHRALRLAATSASWGRIATDAGYYDHAHLVAEFRALVGETPTAYRQR